ncbi:GyrI-like domain-containing protein [Corynebacterium sp.]|uniref:GyrI-like domain-containing protein n=1 Tax=Corynebacterium sp. TaxID=1720 RepID=UPI0026DA8E57|nr:GyrI-like domain-containing protein [Corynebacterium sp.]MDO5077026.1 GyrI-like domain-containing protein [Corynebacterium sp.]
MSIVVSTDVIEPMTIVALTGTVPTYADEPQLWEQIAPLVLDIPVSGPYVCGVIEHDNQYQVRDPKLSVFIPVADDTTVAPPLEVHRFAARECLVAEILGPYSQIPAAYEELESYLETNGLARSSEDSLAAKGFNLYLKTADQVDESKLLTRVCLPLG